MKLQILLTTLSEEGNIRQALQDLLQTFDDFKIQSGHFSVIFECNQRTPHARKGFLLR